MRTVARREMLSPMGFTGQAPPRVVIAAVATLNGSAQVSLGGNGRQHPKARVWLLEDASVVLCIPDKTAPGRVRREHLGLAASAHWRERSKLLTVTVRDAEDPAIELGTLVVNAKGCGCGMGAAGNAGPTEDKRFDVVRVRQPEWYVVTKD